MKRELREVTTWSQNGRDATHDHRDSPETGNQGSSELNLQDSVATPPSCSSAQEASASVIRSMLAACSSAFAVVTGLFRIEAREEFGVGPLPSLTDEAPLGKRLSAIANGTAHPYLKSHLCFCAACDGSWLERRSASSNFHPGENGVGPLRFELKSDGPHPPRIPSYPTVPRLFRRQSRV